MRRRDSVENAVFRSLPCIRYAGTMELPTLAEIQQAQSVVYRHMPPTPQYTWPLINERLSAAARASVGDGRGVEAHRVEAWIKHENHTPVGAFKLRGVWFSCLIPGFDPMSLDTAQSPTRSSRRRGTLDQRPGVLKLSVGGMCRSTTDCACWISARVGDSMVPAYRMHGSDRNTAFSTESRRRMVMRHSWPSPFATR